MARTEHFQAGTLRIEAQRADYLEERNDHTGARWLREEVGQ